MPVGFDPCAKPAPRLPLLHINISQEFYISKSRDVHNLFKKDLHIQHHFFIFLLYSKIQIANMIFFIILELIILVISSPPFLIHYRKFAAGQSRCRAANFLSVKMQPVSSVQSAGSIQALSSVRAVGSIQPFSSILLIRSAQPAGSVHSGPPSKWNVPAQQKQRQKIRKRHQTVKDVRQFPY